MNELQIIDSTTETLTTTLPSGVASSPFDSLQISPGYNININTPSTYTINENKNKDEDSKHESLPLSDDEIDIFED